MKFDLKDIVVKLDQAVKHYIDVRERMELALDDDLADLEDERDGVIDEIKGIEDELSYILSSIKEVEWKYTKQEVWLKKIHGVKI